MASKIPYEFNSIPKFHELEEPVQRRAMEIHRMYKASNPSSTADATILAKACVKLACEEADIGLNEKTDLRISGSKVKLDGVYKSVKQAITKNDPPTKRNRSFRNVLVSLGAFSIDCGYAQKLANAMMLHLKNSGELTGAHDEAYRNEILFQYECAAAHLLSKQQKPIISITKLAEAMGIPRSKLDALVARLSPEANPAIEQKYGKLSSVIDETPTTNLTAPLSPLPDPTMGRTSRKSGGTSRHSNPSVLGYTSRTSSVGRNSRLSNSSVRSLASINSFTSSACMSPTLPEHSSSFMDAMSVLDEQEMDLWDVYGNLDRISSSETYSNPSLMISPVHYSETVSHARYKAWKGEFLKKVRARIVERNSGLN